MDLKKFRHDYRIGQKELAELFGCAQGHISNLESGSRSVTALQIRLLIEKYGAEAVAKYADPGEMPSTVNIDLHRTEIKGNQAPVQNGDGNTMSSDEALVQVLKQQSDQISALIEQQNRLISLLEKK